MCINNNTVIILCVNCIIIVRISNNAVTTNDLLKTLRTYFALQNSHEHAKRFLRNLQTVCARLFGKVRQHKLKLSG